MELMGALSKLDERGATEKLRKVRQRCGEVWKYAIVTGRAEYNPAPDLASAFSPHKKDHYAFTKPRQGLLLLYLHLRYGSYYFINLR